MAFFRRSNRPSLFSKVAPALQQRLTPFGRRCLHWMVQQGTSIERRMSRRQKIVCISIFCLLFAGYSTTLLVEALVRPPIQTPSYLVAPPLSRPLTPYLPDSSTARLRPEQQISAPPDSTDPFSKPK